MDSVWYAECRVLLRRPLLCFVFEVCGKKGVRIFFRRKTVSHGLVLSRSWLSILERNECFFAKLLVFFVIFVGWIASVSCSRCIA